MIDYEATRLNMAEVSPGDISSAQFFALKAQAAEQLFEEANHPLRGIIHEHHAISLGNQKGLINWEAIAGGKGNPV